MADRGPGPIPNRWLRCPRKSDHFIAERFLAFKTPLSKRFEDQMPLDCVFPPEMIFGYMRTLKLKLGLWIDLTNTKRFYDRDIVENKGCQYFKLQCRGHGETPSVEQTQAFIEIVENFINAQPSDIIGVHCTHGFNRTGFLIVSYMVEKLDCSVEAALDAFAQARPPGIYKDDYIRELYRRYDDENYAPAAPPMPDWCFDPEGNDRGHSNNKRPHESEVATSSHEPADDENDVLPSSVGDGEDASNGQTDQPRKKRRRREMINKNATFMTGVDGVHLVTEQQLVWDLQEKVQRMCKWQGNGFPGSQPVSMDINNIQLLHVKPYRVSWKADGTRYMMLINKKDEVYFFDRDFSCFQVENITFPHREDLNRHLTDTLLDGEMVIDRFHGQCIPRYLVYDIIIFENADVGKQPFYPFRLKLIKNEIIQPRHEATRRGLINRSMEPFSVRNKDFWETPQAGALLSKKFAEQLSHEPDGLIFQPSEQPYTPGQSNDVLKWKPLHMNSVDFKLHIIKESGQGILPRKIGNLYVGVGGGQIDKFATIKYTKELKDLDGKIIECKFENHQWVFMRERTDKSFPNSFNTAKAVCNSIVNPVTKEILLDFIKKCRYNEDKEKMPPPPPQTGR